MQIDSPEYKNYDVQYSIRLPQDLADEINARAEQNGVKPSTWIRNSLAKIIRERDEENANSIKTAVMYLLTADKDVQKQIRLLAGEIRENGSRMSNAEAALREFTALTDQETTLQREAGEMESEFVKLEEQMTSLEFSLAELKMKREKVQKVIVKSENSENLHFILTEFDEKEERLIKDSYLIREQLMEKKERMYMNETLLAELNSRKKDLLSICSRELKQNKSGVKDADS